VPFDEVVVTLGLFTTYNLKQKLRITETEESLSLPEQPSSLAQERRKQFAFAVYEEPRKVSFLRMNYQSISTTLRIYYIKEPRKRHKRLDKAHVLRFLADVQFFFWKKKVKIYMSEIMNMLEKDTRISYRMRLNRIGSSRAHDLLSDPVWYNKQRRSLGLQDWYYCKDVSGDRRWYEFEN
jgi:hypothetical protein